MNNDPLLADRDDGGNAGAAFAGYGALAAEKKELDAEKTTEKQMGMTAVKAAELEYAERARKARESVERQIQQAKEAFARRAENMTPKEEVAGRTEMAADFAKMAQEISALKDTILDQNAKIESLEQLIQMMQTESDRRLNNYAEAVTGVEPENSNSMAMPEEIQDELIKNSETSFADEEDESGETSFADETDESGETSFADEADKSEETNFADEGEDVAVAEYITLDGEVVDADNIAGDIDIILDHFYEEKNDKDFEGIVFEERGEEAEEKDSKVEKKERRKSLKERLGKIKNSLKVKAAVGILAVLGLSGIALALSGALKKGADPDEIATANWERIEATDTVAEADEAGEKEEGPKIETNFYVHNERGEADGITENWYQEVQDGAENPYNVEGKESKNAFGPAISDKEFTGDYNGLEREYGMKSAERMAVQPEYMLLRGAFLGAFDDSENAPFATSTNLLSRDGAVSLQNLNKDVNYIAQISREQKQDLLNAAITKSANLFRGTSFEAYTVKAGTTYHTMHFEKVTDENGESHLEIKAGTSVKDYDFEVMQNINEDGKNVWNTDGVKINVLKAMNLIDSSLTLKEAAESGVMDKYTVLGERNACGGQIVVLEKVTKKVQKVAKEKVAPVQQVTPVQVFGGNTNQSASGSVTSENSGGGNTSEEKKEESEKKDEDKNAGKTNYDTLNGAGTVLGETKQDEAESRTDVFGDGTYNVIDNQGQINDADSSTMAEIPEQSENTDATGTSRSDENPRYEAAQEAGGSENSENLAVGQEISAEETEDQSDDRTEQENSNTTQAEQAAGISEFLNNQ